MSNVLDIPQITGASISIASADDWRDQFYVAAPGSPPEITITGSLSGNLLAYSGTDSVVPGMLAVGLGIPSETTVLAVSPEFITLSAKSLVSAPHAPVTFLPAPLDLTGVSFASEIRLSASSASVILRASTKVQTMTNGGPQGTFGWNVPAKIMRETPWPPMLFTQGAASLVLDLVAWDDSGAKINLCEGGPIPLTVKLSVTR